MLLIQISFSKEPRSSLLVLTIGAACLALGCSGSPTPAQGSGQIDSAGGACNVVVTSVKDLSAGHVAECSPLTYPENPPLGGNHYPHWAAYQTFDFAVPRGFWVHDLEHGAAVYTYNCPDGCADEVAQAQAMIDALPVDPGCDGTGVPHRTVLTPDPLLDVRWAASAWGFSLRADCPDVTRFRDFYLNHVGLTLENFCDNGVAFSASPCP